MIVGRNNLSGLPEPSLDPADNRIDTGSVNSTRHDRTVFRTLTSGPKWLYAEMTRLSTAVRSSPKYA